VLDLEEVAELRVAVQEVYADPLIQRWIVDLVGATRSYDGIAIGASVRGSLALERAARAWALLSERAFVVPEDVERLFAPVLLHRVVFTPTFLADVRKRGWEAVSGEFVEGCLAAAPRPAPRADAELVAFAPRG